MAAVIPLFSGITAAPPGEETIEQRGFQGGTALLLGWHGGTQPISPFLPLDGGQRGKALLLEFGVPLNLYSPSPARNKGWSRRVFPPWRVLGPRPSSLFPLSRPPWGDERGGQGVRASSPGVPRRRSPFGLSAGRATLNPPWGVWGEMFDTL